MVKHKICRKNTVCSQALMRWKGVISADTLFPSKTEVRFWDFQKFDFRTSRSFLWKHEKDGTINPALSQSLIPYGIKHPVGENGLYHTHVRDTVTSNDGILRFAFEYNTLIKMIVFCFAFAEWPLLLLRVTLSEGSCLNPKPLLQYRA